MARILFAYLGAAALAGTTLSAESAADSRDRDLGPRTLKVSCDSGDGGYHRHYHKRFPSIRQALERAAPGDTVYVAQGTCEENVSMSTDKVTLKGMAGAVIDGAGDPSSPTVLITARNVVVSGFEIVNGRSGVQVGAGGSAMIADNEISGNSGAGVVVGESGFARIVGNTRAGADCTGISSAGATGDAIVVQDSSAALIEGNCIHGSEDGITVIEGSAVDVVGNTIRDNTRAGISYGSGGSVGLRGLTANTFDQGSALDLRCRSNGSLSVFTVQNFVGGSNNDITTGPASSCTFFNQAGDANIP